MKEKKINIILVVIILILSIALAIMTLVYLNTRKISQNNVDIILSNANEVFETNQKISELEEELEKYKNTNSTTATTITNTSYIPNVVNDDDSSNYGIEKDDIKFNRNPENVTIEVLDGTITNSSVEILITDNNEDKYGWGVEFYVEKNIDGNWYRIDSISDDLSWITIAYNPDKNGQITQKLDIENYYGKLDNGTYRIVKTVYDNGYIDLYSNEFEIK
jgi:flagellar basal body-associated protein FliL